MAKKKKWLVKKKAGGRWAENGIKKHRMLNYKKLNTSNISNKNK